MVFNSEGINRIRDLVKNNIYKTQAGTGTTVPLVSDTALETAVSNTQNTPTLETSDKQITITNSITGSQGSGSDLSEANCELGNSTTQYQLFRVTFNPITKTSSEDHLHITRVFFRNNL